MKLRNHIFFWLIITSLLPLLIIVIAGNQYYQRTFIRSVDIEMIAELNRLGFKLDEQLVSQRALLENLVNSNAVSNFAVALDDAIDAGRITKKFSRERRNIETYFVSLQQLIAEDAILRLMDEHGNTMVKASFGHATKPILESLLPYKLIESEPDPALSDQLEALPVDIVSHRFIHLNKDRDETLMPDAIRPLLTQDGRRLYLIFSHFGERLDKLLDLAPRLRNVGLSIVNMEPANSSEPVVLYGDQSYARFSQARIDRYALDNEIFQNWQRSTEGVFDTSNKEERVYYTEYAPYQDRFTSWAIIAHLNRDELLGQFKVARWGMVLLSLLVLLVSFLAMFVVSRHLSRPICRLASNLRAYAGGKEVLPDMPALSSEVGALQMAYHEMTESLEQAEKDRRRSEKRLLQAEKMASLGEISAGIGHELNNPLTNILSLGKLIKLSKPDDMDFQEDVDSLLEEAQRASKIVSGVLNFGRQINPDIQKFEAQPWIKKCIQRIQGSAQSKGVNISSACDKGIFVSADPYQLEQVLINLLLNAIQASDQAAKILLKSKIQGEEWVVQVTDEGEGLKPEQESRLFEPFYTTRDVGAGSGLGLSISLGIVEVHGGTLRLQNNEEKGCTAEMRIPYKPE